MEGVVGGEQTGDAVPVPLPPASPRTSAVAQMTDASQQQQARFAGGFLWSAGATDSASARLSSCCQAAGWTLWVRPTHRVGTQYVAVKRVDRGSTMDDFKQCWLAQEGLGVSPSLVSLRLLSYTGDDEPKQDKKRLARLCSSLARRWPRRAWRTAAGWWQLSVPLPLTAPAARQVRERTSRLLSGGLDPVNNSSVGSDRSSSGSPQSRGACTPLSFLRFFAA